MRLSARGTQRLTYQLRLALKPECLENPHGDRQRRSPGWSGFDQKHSSCLWFQMLGVEARSSLPHDQHDGGNLPGQGPAAARPTSVRRSCHSGCLPSRRGILSRIAHHQFHHQRFQQVVQPGGRGSFFKRDVHVSAQPIPLQKQGYRRFRLRVSAGCIEPSYTQPS